MFWFFAFCWWPQPLRQETVRKGHQVVVPVEIPAVERAVQRLEAVEPEAAALELVVEPEQPQGKVASTWLRRCSWCLTPIVIE